MASRRASLKAICLIYLNLWSGKSIEEWGIGNGDFGLIDHFSPKIEGIFIPVEKVMKT
jgi:hypothetical protein